MPPQIALEALIPNPGLKAFTPFIGSWETVGHHPMIPGVTFHGRATFDWHESGAFVMMRTEIDEPEIPSGIAIFGNDDGSDTLSMNYFDERKVARRYEAKLEQQPLRWWRTTLEFSQRYAMGLILVEAPGDAAGTGGTNPRKTRGPAQS